MDMGMGMGPPLSFKKQMLAAANAGSTLDLDAMLTVRRHGADVSSEANGSQHSNDLRSLPERLSLSEKLAMLDGDTPFWGGMADIALRDSSHRRPWPAGVVRRLGIGGLHFVDGPRGVTLEGGATTFPAPIARGASWDVDLEERIGEAMGREARSFGANLFGGVCVNLLRHPGWGRAQETYRGRPAPCGRHGGRSHPGRPTPCHRLRQAFRAQFDRQRPFSRGCERQ